MFPTLLLTFLGCNFFKGEEAAPAEATPAASESTAPAGDIPAPADVAAPPADAQKTASGLAYKVLTPGTGAEKPTEYDTVEVNYTGWTTDGKMFDSSVKRGKTAKFKLKSVIPGWTEGVQLMVEGEKARFWIPAEMAYGDVPKRPGAPAGDLTFDIELVAIKPAGETSNAQVRPVGPDGMKTMPTLKGHPGSLRAKPGALKEAAKDK